MSTRRKETAPPPDLGTAQVRPLPIEQVCAKGDLCLQASNGLLFVAPADIVPARRVRFGACRGAEADVLFEHPDGWLMLDTSPMPIVQHRDWCQEIPAASAGE